MELSRHKRAAPAPARGTCEELPEGRAVQGSEVWAVSYRGRALLSGASADAACQRLAQALGQEFVLARQQTLALSSGTIAPSRQRLALHLASVVPPIAVAHDVTSGYFARRRPARSASPVRTCHRDEAKLSEPHGSVRTRSPRARACPVCPACAAGMRCNTTCRARESAAMKIVLYGEPHFIGSGAYCYSETLKELGHEVIPVRDDFGLAWYRTLPGRVTKKALGHIAESHRQRHTAELVRVVRERRPELVLVLKGLFVGAEEVRAMRAAGAFVAIINHDDLFSLNPNNWSTVQRAALPHYSYILVTREVNVAEVGHLNRNVEFFPFAYYPGIHRKLEIPEHERALFESDVVFVGTWEAERCRLLEHLVQSVPARYAIWGSHWSRAGKRTPLAPFIVGRIAMMDDQCKAIGGAKIALAFLRRSNRDDYTQRTFEIPACGGLLLGERTARHLSFYREGSEAEFFDPQRPEELVAKVRSLLADDERRDALREAGRRALERQHHTYRDRLLRVFELYRQTGSTQMRLQP